MKQTIHHAPASAGPPTGPGFAPAPPTGGLRRLAEIVIIAAIYCASGRLGQLLAIPPGNITPVGLPSGFILAAVLTRGYRVWPGILLGAFAGNAWAYFDFASAGAVLRSLFAGTANGLGDTLGAFVGAYLTHRTTGGRHPLHRATDLAKLLGYGGVLNAGLSALVGVASLGLAGLLPWSQAGFAFTTWWIGDGMGVLLLTPLLLAWAGGGRGCRLGREELAVMAGLTAFGLVLGLRSEFAFTVAGVPLLLWAVLRFDPRVSFILITTFAAATIVTQVFGHGPFVSGQPAEQLLLLQLFLGSLLAPLLVLSGALTERETPAGVNLRPTHVFGAACALLTAVTVTAGTYYYRSLEREHRAAIEQNLTVIAQLKIGELVQFRSERMADAMILSNNPAIAQLVRRFFTQPADADAARMLQAWLAKYRGHYQYDEVFLLDAQGVVRLSASEFPVQVSAALRVHLPEALRSAQPQFVDFYRHENNQQIYLSLLVPVHDATAGGRPLGVLVLRMAPQSYLYPFIQRWPTASPTGETVLVRQEGNEVVCLNELRFRPNSALRVRLSLAQTEKPAVLAALGRTGIIPGVDYRDVQVLAYTQRVPDSPWMLVAKLDAAEAYAPLWEQLTQVAVITALLLAIAVAGAALVWREQGRKFFQSRLAAEQAQREVEARYHLLFERANDGIMLLATDGQVIDANASCARLHGYRAEEMAALNLRALVTPETAQQVPERMARLLAGETLAIEAAHRRKDGTVILLEMTASAVTFGSTSCFLCLYRDITERKETEVKLALSNEMLERTSALAKIGGWELDLRTTATPFSQATTRIHELNVAELTEKLTHVAEKVSDQRSFSTHEAGPTVATAMQAAIAHGTAFDLESPFVTAQGRHLWVRVQGYAVLENGKVTKLRGTLQDLTEHQQAQEQTGRLLTEMKESHQALLGVIEDQKATEEVLRQSEERYRLLFEHNPLAMWLYERGTLQFLAVNEAAVQRYGYTRSEFLAMTLRQICNPEDVPALLERLAAESPTANTTAELRHRRKDGATLHVETFSSPLNFAGRSAQLSLINDITEKKLFEQKFLHAQRLESVGMLAAGIAHDLNNMLAPIVFAAPLLRPRLSAARDLKIIDTIELSAARGAALVRQILGFVHTTSSEFQPTQVKHLARDIISLIQETFPKSIQFDYQVPSDLWPVTGNATQIHQVLLNLCVNARDAMPAGGTLRLVVANRRLTDAESEVIPNAAPGDWLMIEVSDTGTGISPEVMQHIWTPFFTTKDPGHGTGLGLTTVRSIVLNHHGFIELQTAAGQGTVFRIYLPAKAGEVARVVAASPVAPTPGHDELILVVDDEAAIRDSITAILKERGYRAVSCADGVEALALFNARPKAFSLVITDVDMPRLGGAELVHALLEIRPDIQLLAISGLSARGAEHIDTPSIQTMVHEFLHKPFQTEVLLDAVHRLLHPPQSS